MPKTPASAAPVAETSPVVTVSPEPTPEATLNPAQGTQLLREFRSALANEKRALEHRHKFEIKELAASQSSRKKDWEKSEKNARHQFFAEHPKGPERRAYVQEFIERRKAFLNLLKDEKKQREDSQKIRMDALKKDQLERTKEFEASIKNKAVPANRLWPQAGK